MKLSNILKNFTSRGSTKKLILIIIIFLSAVSVGVVAVTYNELFLWGTNIARQRYLDNRALIFITVPVFFLLSAWICKKFAPNADGGGTDHVMTALEKLSKPGHHTDSVKEYLSFRILVVKIISSVICVMGGGALGREGPVVQISASIFTLVAEKIKKFIPHFDLRTWIIAGSAAGVAAAFNTPLAGIVFAIEELSQFHFEQQFSGFKTKAFFAVIVAGVTAQFITGSYVLFDFPIMHFTWEMQMALVLLLVSSICGLTARILKGAISITSIWRKSVTGKGWYLFPIISGLIVASVSYVFGDNTFGAGVFTIEESLRSPTSNLTYLDSIGRFINIIATAASGAAGGLLLPALALGAGIGSVGSELLPAADSRIFVATGMAAFLGALLNAPLTAAVLVLEVTNQRELVFPLFLSTLAASWIFQNSGTVAHKKYASALFSYGK